MGHSRDLDAVATAATGITIHGLQAVEILGQSSCKCKLAHAIRTTKEQCMGELVRFESFTYLLESSGLADELTEFQVQLFAAN